LRNEYSGQTGFFVTFGENFLIGFNKKNRNDQEPGTILTGIFIEMGVIEIEYEPNKI